MEDTRIGSMGWSGKAMVSAPVLTSWSGSIYLATVSRGGYVNHTGTVPVSDAGAGGCSKASNRWSSSGRSVLIFYAKQRTLKNVLYTKSHVGEVIHIASGSCIRSLQSIFYFKGVFWISTLKSLKTSSFLGFSECSSYRKNGGSSFLSIRFSPIFAVG